MTVRAEAKRSRLKSVGEGLRLAAEKGEAEIERAKTSTGVPNLFMRRTGKPQTIDHQTMEQK